mgnify:CR=1 FL=1
MVIWLILIEMIVIMLQSFQSSDSYTSLNFSSQTTELLSKILQPIGIVTIAINALVAMYICFFFFRDIHLKPPAYLWGIRIGLVVFIVSCGLGLFLLAHYEPVPADPTYLGFPFTQIRSVKSSLITIHFVGIHYLQLLPFLGYLFPTKNGILLIVTLSLLYLFFFVFAVFKADNYG